MDSSVRIIAAINIRQKGELTDHHLSGKAAPTTASISRKVVVDPIINVKKQFYQLRKKRSGSFK
jgi:hypothetical protein